MHERTIRGRGDELRLREASFVYTRLIIDRYRSIPIVSPKFSLRAHIMTEDECSIWSSSLLHCYKVLQSSVFSRPQFVRGIGCDECWVGLRLEQVNSRDDRNPPRPPPTPCPARWVLNRRPFACKAEPLTLRLRELGHVYHHLATTEIKTGNN